MDEAVDGVPVLTGCGPETNSLARRNNYILKLVAILHSHANPRDPNDEWTPVRAFTGAFRHLVAGSFKRPSSKVHYFNLPPPHHIQTHTSERQVIRHLLEPLNPETLPSSIA